MKSESTTSPGSAVTRRRLLQALAAAGVTGPLALEALAQSGPQVSADTLRRAAALIGEDLGPARLAVAEKAVQRNQDYLQALRELVIDDAVEPAPVFLATRPAVPAVTADRKGR